MCQPARTSVRTSDVVLTDPKGEFENLVENTRRLRVASAAPTREALRWFIRHDISLGHLYGYPRCCIAWFVYVAWRLRTLPAQLGWLASNNGSWGAGYVLCPRCGGYSRETAMRLAARVEAEA